MSVEIAVQTALRARLIATPEVTVLVPAEKILDRNGRTRDNPSIILGEDQVIDEGQTLKRDRLRIYSTLHLWKKEEGLTGVKAISWAIRTAIRPARLNLGDNFHCVDCLVSDHRFLRDPDGETAHGIVTVETLVEVLS